MLVNLFAAHLTRFGASPSCRSGIQIILHLGVILLMGGELITGIYAVESRMMMQVGESKNYIDNSRKIELAFTDEATHRTITIPQDMLTAGKTITDPDLPVDVEVLERYKNTTARWTSGGDDSDTIISVSGIRYKVVPASEGSGVKSEQSEDVPAVRVRLLKKGTQEEAIPERMYSLWDYENGPLSRMFMALPSRISVGDTPSQKTYTIGLRYQRIYKPYTITLLAFEHKKYAGTNTPKDFASTVRLQDPETGDDREVRIWMNHPLRHRGETFYQQSTLGSEDVANGTKRHRCTVLQVVNNPGWLLPLHILLRRHPRDAHSLPDSASSVSTKKNAAKLLKGKQGPANQPEVKEQSADSVASNPIDIVKKWFPVGRRGRICTLRRHAAYPQTRRRIPGFRSGRVWGNPCSRRWPREAARWPRWARTKMLFISGRSEFEEKDDGKTQPAILWLLEVLASDDPNHGKAGEFPVFRIDNEQVLQLLELKYKPGSYRYSIKEIRPKFDAFIKALKTAEELDENKRDLYHAKIIELANRLRTYEALARHATPTLIPKEKGSAEWLTLAEIDEKVAKNKQLYQEARAAAEEVKYSA